MSKNHETVKTFFAKALPSSPDAERGVLGGIIARPQVYDEVVNIVEPADFTDAFARECFTAMGKCIEKGDDISKRSNASAFLDRFNKALDARGLPKMSDFRLADGSGLMTDVKNAEAKEAVQQKIQIQRARCIRNTALAAKALLDAEKFKQQRMRVQLGIQRDRRVDEVGLVFQAHRRGAVQAGAFEQAYAREHGEFAHDGPQTTLGIAQIGAESHIGNRQAASPGVSGAAAFLLLLRLRLRFFFGSVSGSNISSRAA